MKKIILNSFTVITLFFASAANAQVGVGVSAENIHPSAELEVKSSTKGFLPPRMTKAERDAIVTPAAGLLIYQTDGDANNPTGLYFFDGTAWKNGLGLEGAKGDRGETGLNGTAGDIGPKGDQGEKGDTGNGFNNGTATNQIMYWNGSAWVTLNPGSDNQILKISNGNLIWSSIFPDGYVTSIMDIYGTLYKTVNIGTQQWMAENLKVTNYNDGTEIPNIKDNTEWSKLTTGAWTYYDNDEANNAKSGKLYNWYAVSPTTNGNKNICPTGWHVPTYADWTVLTEYLGGVTVAGSKMKVPGNTNWPFGNEDANNSSLFSAIPGGSRSSIGEYLGMTDATFWSSTPYGTDGRAYFLMLLPHNGLAYSANYSIMNGLSVRCLRD